MARRNNHFYLTFPKVKWPKPVSPTIEEIEKGLPGLKDQCLPKIMTPEILEDVIPSVQQFREFENHYGEEAGCNKLR